MHNIGGNITAKIQRKLATKNKYGESELTWEDVVSVHGFLDLMSGNSNYTSYNSKLVDSTHVFICDYQPLNVNVENCRMIINNERYDMTYIDNPMGLNYHLEIFLKYLGGTQDVS